MYIRLENTLTAFGTLKPRYIGVFWFFFSACKCNGLFDNTTIQKT